jgi:hypothetical protein
MRAKNAMAPINQRAIPAISQMIFLVFQWSKKHSKSATINRRVITANANFMQSPSEI